jgi:hypothetical protein
VLFERHRELWARTPDVAARSNHRLANMHIHDGDMRRGRAALLRALRQQPRRVKYWGLLGLSLFGRTPYVRIVPRLRSLFWFLA